MIYPILDIDETTNKTTIRILDTSRNNPIVTFTAGDAKDTTYLFYKLSDAFVQQYQDGREDGYAQCLDDIEEEEEDGEW